MEEALDKEAYALQLKMQALRGEIKTEVLQAGETIDSEHLIAIYSKPRVTWNSTGLEGFMVAHPEIKAFRKEGKPSVSIRSKSDS